MDLNSILRFGNMAVGMMNTPQFKNMAKFIVPFLNSPPASPSPDSGQPSTNSANGGHHSIGGSMMHGAPLVPPYMGNGFPLQGFHGMPGIPGTRPQSSVRQTRPRLGGLQALQGLMGHSSPAGSSAANPSGYPMAPFKQVFKYATPQNLQKVMEWHGVMKQFAGMVGLGGSAAAGEAAAGGAAASAKSVKSPKQLRVSEASDRKHSGALASDRAASSTRRNASASSTKSSGKRSTKQRARSGAKKK